MIYPDVALSEWIERYSLMVLPYDCPKCGGRFLTTVPVWLDGYAGLESEVHACGAQFTRLVLAPRAEETRDLLRRAVGGR